MPVQRERQRERNARRRWRTRVVLKDTEALLKSLSAHVQQAEQERCEVAAAAGAAQRAEHAQLLSQVYEQLDQEVFFSKGGWVIPARERSLIDAISAGAATYGEVAPAGIEKLLSLLALDRGSSFCDLGSGIGRVVLAAAMGGAVGEAVGLELSDSRLEQAEAAAEVLSGLGVPLRPARFVRADLATCDLDAVAGATHYFMCSTAFGAALCRSLAARLACSPRFRVLVTSRPLPPQPYLMKVGQVEGIGYSWIADGAAHVYVKDWPSAPPAVLTRFLCRGGVCWAPPAGGGGGGWVRGLVVGDEPIALRRPQGGGDAGGAGR
ncbi:MAG: hypothetical protein J3K34DRAFT_491686 [Monoraphidium minutum]|nr:MAG: hypothetical protein J3K34DRAFT_491686 [Monoraphidium minutum]